MDNPKNKNMQNIIYIISNKFISFSTYETTI